MGIVIFLAGMIVGGFIGVFLLALVSSNHEGEDKIPDDTDMEEKKPDTKEEQPKLGTLW